MGSLIPDFASKLYHAKCVLPWLLLALSAVQGSPNQFKVFSTPPAQRWLSLEYLCDQISIAGVGPIVNPLAARVFPALEPFTSAGDPAATF